MEINKADHHKHIVIAKNKCTQGKYFEANEIYKKLMESNYHSLDLISSYAIFNKQLRNNILAKQLFYFSIKKFPSFTNSYILLAEMLRNENNFDESEKILLQAKMIVPNNGDIFYNLSLLYKIQLKNKIAINFVDQAIKLSHENKIYKILKAELLMDCLLYTSPSPRDS